MTARTGRLSTKAKPVTVQTIAARSPELTSQALDVDYEAHQPAILLLVRHQCECGDRDPARRVLFDKCSIPNRKPQITSMDPATITTVPNATIVIFEIPPVRKTTASPWGRSIFSQPFKRSKPASSESP